MSKHTYIVETQCRVLDPENLMYLQLTETSEKSCIEESKRPALYFNLFYVFCRPKTIKPLAVCSARAGCTGTYMAIDTMMYQLEDTQDANIFEYVEMRTRRTQMVQNAVSDMV